MQFKGISLDTSIISFASSVGSTRVRLQGLRHGRPGLDVELRTTKVDKGEVARGFGFRVSAMATPVLTLGCRPLKLMLQYARVHIVTRVLLSWAQAVATAIVVHFVAATFCMQFWGTSLHMSLPFFNIGTLTDH